VQARLAGSLRASSVDFYFYMWRTQSSARDKLRIDVEDRADPPKTLFIRAR